MAGKPYVEALIKRAGGCLFLEPDDDELRRSEDLAAAAAMNRKIVVDTTVLNIATVLGDRWQHIRARFNSISLPSPTFRDLLQGRDLLALRSTGSLSWDKERDTVRMDEITQEQAEAIATQAQTIASLAMNLSIVDVSSYEHLPIEGVEDAAPWLAPLELAKRLGAALYSDDIGIRNIARSLEIPTFGTMAVLRTLTANQQLTEDELAECRIALRKAFVVDFTPDLGELLAIAEEEGYAPGSASFSLTRPAFWQDRSRSVPIYRQILQRVNSAAPDLVHSWIASATYGLVRNLHDLEGTKLAAQFITASALGLGWSSTIFAACIKGGRQACGELGLADPFPLAVKRVLGHLTQGFAGDEAARLALSLVADFEATDRLLAVEAILDPHDN